MTDAVDNLLSRHYSAHVLKSGDVDVVISDMKALLSIDAAAKNELDQRMANIQNIRLSDTDLSQRCFSTYIELVALRRVLTPEVS